MSDLSPAQFESLRHHHHFGRRGDPPTKRVTSTSWKTHPFKKPITSQWNQSVPRAELPKLLNGFRPAQMEDKWFVYADGPDAQGHAIIHFHRSWTGYKCFELKLVIEMDESGEFAEGKDAQFTEITFESEGGNDELEESAKSTAKTVCTWCMDVEFP